MPLATTISGRRHAVNWPTVLRDRTSASPHRKANRIAEAAFAGLSLAILAAGFLNAQPTHAPRGRLAPVSAPRWEHVALSTTYFWVKVWRVRWVMYATALSRVSLIALECGGIPLLRSQPLRWKRALPSAVIAKELCHAPSFSRP